jgi:hypothetical protein
MVPVLYVAMKYVTTFPGIGFPQKIYKKREKFCFFSDF